MTDNITYRGTDPTRWGTGQESDLSAEQIDINFWFLYSSLVALQDHAGANADIDYFVVTGNQLFVHLTNHAVLGPYILPIAQWNFKEEWTPITHYGLLDVVTSNGSLYIVVWDHTSDATFDPNAGDGAGHDYYKLLLAQPANMLPTGGTARQRLVKIDAADFNVAWDSDYRHLALFIQGKPAANELLLRYLVTENLTLPAGLPGSGGSAGVPTTTSVAYAISKNGTAIGNITFPATGAAGVISFSTDIGFVSGDILSINGPAIPDGDQANISITLHAALA
jgi:hypothetical protein